MNILFISGSFPFEKDGIGDSAECLYRKLAEKDRVVLLTTKKDSIISNITEKKYKNVHYIDRWNISYKRLKKIENIIEKNNIDVIHIEYPGQAYGKHILINILPIVIRLKYKNIKLFMRYHEFTCSRLLRKIVDLPLIICMNKIFVASHIDYKVLRKFFNNKIQKTFLGSSIDFNRRISSRENDEFVLGYFGFVYKGKEIERLLYIMKDLVEIDKKIKLKMLCSLDENDSYHLKIKNLIKLLNLDEYVTVTGYLSVNDLKREFNKIDIATLFFSEGISLKRTSMLSFIFSGIPIITSLGDDECNSIFDKEKNIFMSNDNLEIINYILELKNNYEKYNYRSDETFKLKKYFDWNEIAGNIYKTYLE